MSLLSDKHFMRIWFDLRFTEETRNAAKVELEKRGYECDYDGEYGEQPLIVGVNDGNYAENTDNTTAGTPGIPQAAQSGDAGSV